MSGGFALSFVVPVYRGARTIGLVVDEIATLRIDGGHEVVLVDDGSPDDSGEVCRALARRTDLPVTLVSLSRNVGEHNSVMAGLRQARGEYVITVDDDLQNPISEALRVYEHARAGGWDVVYTRYPAKRHAPWRNLGSRFANAVADHLLDKPRGLYLSSFRCMSAFVVRHVVRYEGPFPYVDGLVLQVAGRIDSIEVQHLPRAEGRSNYTLRKLVRLWLNLFVNFSIKPLRIATATGFGFVALGVVGTAVVLWEALEGRTPAGWASLAAATLVLSGVQLLILGIFGEYLGNLLLAVNRKPQSVVREVVGPAAAPDTTAARIEPDTRGSHVAAAGAAPGAAAPRAAEPRVGGAAPGGPRDDAPTTHRA
jgi:glycosyltransferase involved in cell wall biosynthesis